MRISKGLGVSFAALSSALGMGVLTAPQPAFAQETQATRNFDIPPQSLEGALQAFAAQTDRNVIFTPSMVAGKTSPGAQGQMSEPQALEALLAGSGLSFEQSGSNGYAVRDPNSPIRLGDARRNNDTAPSDGNVEEVIVVVGTNIRGVYPASSPLSLHTAEDIERTGAATTEQFISKLPQNLSSLTQNAPSGTRAGNRDAINAVDLRGLGIGTTLILLNGRRMPLGAGGLSADISMIPVGAIERVEVLTDGASAIYGSDAVGGVVNFVLRDDFQGAETRIFYGGVTSGNLRQGNLTQTFGRSWGSGNGLVSFDYYAASSLEYADRPYSQTVAPGTHTPVDNRATILGAFQQQIGVDTEVAGDFAYMNRNVKRDATARPGIFLLHNYNLYESETDSYFANLGLDHELNEALTATFAASYANLEVDGYSLLRFINQPAVAPIIQTATGDVSYSALDLTAQIGGTLLTLPAGEMRFSAGAGQLDEEYNVLSRQTQYLFGEVFVPIVSEDQNVPFVERLELSLAARFTSFEDAGQDTVPKIGLLWSPISPFTIRATYGESFRAPSLAQLDPNGATNQLERALVGVTAPAPYLRVLGPMAGLAPETAETATIGFDFRPEWLGGFELSGTYFTIDYTGQIARAAQSGNAFINPAANLDILYPAPSAAYVEELLRSTRNTGNTTGLPIDFSDPASAATTLFADPNFRVLDDRFRNLALSEVEGLDASISTRFDTPIGEVGLGVQATRIFEFNKQNSPNAPIVIVVDRSLYPVDFRGRAFASLSNGGFSGTISINYVDDYTNAVAVGGSTPIESWTTADLSLTYEIGADDSARFLSGTRVSFSVQNMTDEDPPFLGSGLGTDGTLTNPIGFDPANANPLGRLVTLGVTHRW